MRHIRAREVQACAAAFDASVPSLYNATSGGSLVAANGVISRWEDQSGNARHVTQNTAARKPVFRAAGLNSRMAVEFDGVDDFLSFGTLDVLSFFDAAGTSITVLLVLSQDAAQARNTPFATSNMGTRFTIHATYDNTLYFDAGTNSSAGRLSVAQPSGWDDAAHVFAGVRSGANGYIASDNSVLATKSNFSHTASSTTTTLYVGTFGGSLEHDGKISEAMVWARGLSDAVARRMWHSRQRKWGIRG